VVVTARNALCYRTHLHWLEALEICLLLSFGSGSDDSHRQSDLVQNISLLAANGLMGAVNLQPYLWARSIWPRVALHLWWNLSNETILDDVYGWLPGLFDGKFGVFNAEGVFGCIVLLPIAAVILFRLKDMRYSVCDGENA
jgi:hypothetical protein